MTGITDPAEEHFKDGLWGWDSDAGAWIKCTASDGKLQVETVAQAHNTTHAVAGDDKLKYTRQILWYIPDTALTTGTNKSATIVYRGPDFTLVRWDFRVKTAPTGTSLILDINIAGTSLWNSTQADRPTIAATAYSGTDTSFDTATITDGAVLTFDIDQIGSTIPGGQATLTLEGDVNLESD